MPRGRMTIGLYNSYDPIKFAEAHRRAIARAAPVAIAFDANVATFGFPFDKDLRTPLQVAAWISGTTSIGEEGRYLRDLAGGDVCRRSTSLSGASHPNSATS